MPEGFRGLEAVAAPDFWAPLSLLDQFRRGQQGREGVRRPPHRRAAEARPVARPGARAAARVGLAQCRLNVRASGAASLVLEPRLGTVPLLDRGDAAVHAALLCVRPHPDDRVRERRQPAARARGRPPARDWHPAGDWRVAAPRRLAVAHRKPAARTGLRGARLRHLTARARGHRLRGDRAPSRPRSATFAWRCRQRTGASRCSWWPARWSRPCSSRSHRRFRPRAWSWCGRFAAKWCVMPVPAAPGMRSSRCRSRDPCCFSSARPSSCAARGRQRPSIPVSARPISSPSDVLNEQRRGAILDVVKSEPSVASVAASWPGVLGGRPAFADGASGKSTVTYQFVSPEYFGVLGIDLVRGRGFTETERSADAAVAIVSEGVARQLWPGHRRDRAGRAARAGPDKSEPRRRPAIVRRSRAASSSSASPGTWRASGWAASGWRAPVSTCRSAPRPPGRRS